MKILSGMILLPLVLTKSSRGREKIDSRLLKKTRTLGEVEIPAIIFSREDKRRVCRKFLESKVRKRKRK